MRLRRELLAAGLATALGVPAAALAQERQNFFHDPFVQVTSALAACPVPEGPLITRAELREQAHVRAQHGGSCFRAGRCRLPNSYLYDAEIIPRVALYLQQDGRFADTSVWVLGERRLVTLLGCVQSEAQSQAAERAVLLVDDVMGVINLLSVGTQAAPRYGTVPATPTGTSGPASPDRHSAAGYSRNS